MHFHEKFFGIKLAHKGWWAIKQRNQPNRLRWEIKIYILAGYNVNKTIS